MIPWCLSQRVGEFIPKPSAIFFLILIKPASGTNPDFQQCCNQEPSVAHETKTEVPEFLHRTSVPSTLLTIYQEVMKPVQQLRWGWSIGVFILLLPQNGCRCWRVQVELETAKDVSCVAYLGCFIQLSLTRIAECWLTISSSLQLGMIAKVWANWVFPPMTGERCYLGF